MSGPEVVDELYAAERSSLLTLAWMMLGTVHDAEDALHECFARLDADRLATVDQPRAYVRTMVRNECLDVIRHRRRVTPTADLPAGVHLDPTLGEFADLLLGLSERRRTAVVLRYYLDLPVKEIAAVMRCRPSTVSSLLNRAHRDLEAVLHVP